jgi:Flp pilus assembly protein TadG
MMLRKGLRSQDGGALVEFAVVLPLLLLILFGFIESGILIYNKQVVTNASREVARAAINPLPLLSPTNVVAAATPYNSLLIRFGTTDPLSVTSPPANREYPQNVSITVTWDHHFLLPLLLRWMPTVTLESQTTVRMM